MRAHPEPIGYYPSLPRTPSVQPAPAAATVLFVVPDDERSLYTGEQFTRVYAHNSIDALKGIATMRPRLVVIDWDGPSLGAMEICAAASASSQTSILVTTGDVTKVPSILKAGCHGVLLKPFPPNLISARISRVIKETERPWGQKTPSDWRTGTNRVWADSLCPKCGVRGATSFDFSSYRRMWYACLSCDATWLGPRQE